MIEASQSARDIGADVQHPANLPRLQYRTQGYCERGSFLLTMQTQARARATYTVNVFQNMR